MSIFQKLFRKAVPLKFFEVENYINHFQGVYLPAQGSQTKAIEREAGGEHTDVEEVDYAAAVRMVKDYVNDNSQVYLLIIYKGLSFFQLDRWESGQPPVVIMAHSKDASLAKFESPVTEKQALEALKVYWMLTGREKS